MSDTMNLNFIKDLIQNRFNKSESKAFIKTYGCQQNFSDSEKIMGVLSNLGFTKAKDEFDADLILFNTCAIREHAEDRVFGNVGSLKKLKKEKPELIIALCGCMTEQNHIKEKIKKSFSFVDLVFGTNSIEKIPKLICDLILKNNSTNYNLDYDIHNENTLSIRESKIKALVPIMYGCDNFCTYCIVPYVRGREKSRKPEDIINEIKDLINAGYKEIMLLGQNVNSYGKGLDEDINFSKLLQKIDIIDGDYWIRFMTSHPKDVTKDLIDTIANSQHICKSLHLPLQSGNDNILKRMNRHYTTEQYLKIINYAKSKIPKIYLTSDIIVGFPSETCDEFCETLDLIRKVKYSALFTFIFSKRVGTPAFKMDDPVPYKEKSKWFSELLNCQNEIGDKIYQNEIGNVQKVLIDGKNSKGKLTARNQGNMIVELDGEDFLIGQFKNVKIIKAKRNLLIGEII